MLSCQVCSGHGGKLCPASVVANNGDHLKQHSPHAEGLLLFACGCGYPCLEYSWDEKSNLERIVLDG